MAFLNKEQAAYDHYIDYIGQYLDECRDGKCVIYTSTLTIAEVTRKRLVNSTYGTFTDFLNEYQGAIIQVSADPNVMQIASEIKSLSYSKTGSKKREIGTADAIHLASALALRDTFGVTLSAFHTFDNGGSKGIDGKSVPLLSYEDWCENCLNDPVAQKVIWLPRKKPDHPNPRLFNE